MKELIIALLILTVLIAGCVSQAPAQSQGDVIQQSIDDTIDQEIDNALNNISMDDIEAEIGQQI